MVAAQVVSDHGAGATSGVYLVFRIQMLVPLKMLILYLLHKLLFIGAGGLVGKGTYPAPNGDNGTAGGDSTFNGQMQMVVVAAQMVLEN